VFVIDSSESVGPENFEIIKDFVTRLVDRTTVGRNATRIGLVLYSLDVHLEFHLARHATKQEVKQAIRKMPYMGEGTYTGTAIRKATQEAFYSARNGVRKVAIVITDGQTDRREPVKLDLAVREAHAANIEMYALGIVNSSDPTQADFLQELNLIASDPDTEHMYLIDDFNTLPGERPNEVLLNDRSRFCYRTVPCLCFDSENVLTCLLSFFSTGVSAGQSVL
jgi:uncharacterized protein with von Willebrand factor type A (vWA) domain